MALKFPILKWHPVTRQRWARFRGLRRGWWAFWILIGAYAVSLFSEWLANDRPLWVRFEGRSYFPVAKFYPEDVFAGNGRMTRPDYKALAAGGAFAPGSGNWMVWPPIPYGPLESLKAEDIQLPAVATVTATPEPRVASADVDASGRVVRAAGDAGFFGLQVGASAGEWPEIVRAGVAARFADRPAEAVDAENNGIWTSLSPYAPRGAPPARVRLTFREELAAGAHGVEQVVFAVPRDRFNDNLAQFEHAFAAFPDKNPVSFAQIAAERAAAAEREAAAAAQDDEDEDDWRKYL